MENLFLLRYKYSGTIFNGIIPEEIELYIFSHVYNNIIHAYKEKYREEDENFYRRCLELRNHLEDDIVEIGKKLTKPDDEYKYSWFAEGMYQAISKFVKYHNNQFLLLFN